MPKHDPKIPLWKNNTEPGFESINNLKDLAKQKVKMVLLTIPGERVMLPEFGVGIQELMFESIDNVVIIEEFKSIIFKQISQYVPEVEVSQVDFQEIPEENKMSISLTYFVPLGGFQDTVTI